MSAPPSQPILNAAGLDAYHQIEAFQRLTAETERRRSRRERREALRHDSSTVKLFDGYRPHLKQWEAHQSFARFWACCAGRRGGKTHAGAREFLKRIYGRGGDLSRKRAQGLRWAAPDKITHHTVPLLHYWCIAPTYAVGLVQQRALAALLLRWPQLVLNWTGTRLWLAGGILVEFKSADNPKRLVGEGLNGLWIDEAARVKADVWKENLYATLAENRGWALFTTTPLGRNWFHDDVWIRGVHREPGYAAFSWFTVDNTSKPELVLEAEEARRTMPPAVYRRNFEASFEAYEGQVFEEFSEAIHVVKPSAIPYGRFHRVVGGLDFGFVNPGAAVLSGVDGDGTWWVWRERYERRLQVWVDGQGRDGRGNDSWGRWLRHEHDRRRIHSLWCDPSRPSDIELLADRAGLPAGPADNSRLSGIETLATLLHVRPDTGKPSAFISSDCVAGLREIPAYHYDTDTEGRVLERPEKVDDHWIDAWRYAAHTEAQYGGVPIVRNLALVR